jgi:hypothetical protein
MAVYHCMLQCPQCTATLTPDTACCAVEITEAYLSAASYTSTECKYEDIFGVDTSFTIGGGEQGFTFRRSAQARTGVCMSDLQLARLLHCMLGAHLQHC